MPTATPPLGFCVAISKTANEVGLLIELKPTDAIRCAYKLNIISLRTSAGGYQKEIKHRCNMFSDMQTISRVLGDFLFPPTNRRKGWVSWKLAHSAILLFSLLEIGLIVSLEVVLRLSRKNDGFVTVNLPDSQSISENPFRQSHWTQKYLWTTLPTFIITLYKICWSTILLNSPFVSLLLKCPSRKALQGKEPSFWTIGPTSLLFPGYMNSKIDMLCLDSHS